MPNPLLPCPANADRRPRIHIKPQGDRYAFRHGATGINHVAATRGEAFERAIDALGGQAAVIIFEGASRG